MISSNHHSVGCSPVVRRSSRCLPAAALGLVALSLLVAAPVSAQLPAAESATPVLSVPGGLPLLARTLGAGEQLPASRVLLTAVRVLWEAPEGADRDVDRRRGEVLASLRGAAAPAPGKTADGVPAFLPLETWALILRQPGDRRDSLLTEILGTRHAALLYYGVASLDAATRAYLAAHPDLLLHLAADDRVGVFATFGRSLRVSNGRIEVPGGAEAVPLWEDLAGERVTNPAGFMRTVLDKDGGRLALLYDGLAHVDDATQRFALGRQLPAGERADRFRKLYDASAAALSTWDPRKRPFERMPFDVVHLFLSMRAGPDGVPAAPRWRRLWEKALDGGAVPDAVQWGKGGVEGDGVLDAAALVELVAVQASGVRRERAEAWLFAGRVFPSAPSSAAADLLVALNGFSRYPSLLLTLERLGIRSPSTFAAAVRAAGGLSAADRRLWQFQAALAVLERARSARSIDAASADRLVAALCAVTPEGGDPYLGAVARWLDRDFLGTVPQAIVSASLPTADRAIETRVLAAMAGAVSSPANTALLALPPLEWEGLTYRVNPAAATLRRLVGIRSRQGGVSLDAVIALARIADAIQAAPSADAARIAAQQLPAVALALVTPAGGEGREAAGDEKKLVDLAADAVKRAGKLKPVPDRKELARIAKPLLEIVDDRLAEVLGSIAYAPHLGEVEGTAMLGGDPSTRHDLRFFKAGSELNRRTAWDLPVEVQDREVGRRVTGSLLGLDLALGRLALRRVARETIPEGPRFSDSVRQAFTETVVLMAPFDLRDETRDLLLAAVERGRARVAALGPASPDLARVVSDSGMDEWRAEALRWTLVHEAERSQDLFSLAELALAGGLDPATLPALDAWGTSGFSLDQGLEMKYPARLAWTTVAGRRTVRSVPAFVLDLTIGLAAESQRLRLPAALVPGLLTVATQDFLDSLRTAHEDDWPAMVAHARAIARSGIEDYVAGLTIDGPLVPDDKELEHAR